MESDPLARIEARLERVEATLDRLAAALDQVQPTLAMASDIADEWVAEKVGGDELEQRLESLEKAVLQITEPRTLDAVTRLVAMAPGLESTAALAAGFDDTVGMAADIADEWVRENLGGDEAEVRISAGLDALTRLSEPAVIGALTRLAERAPRLEKLADLAASFEDTVAMGADIADEFVREKVGGDSVEQRLQAGTDALLALSDPTVLGALTRIASQAPLLERVAGLAAGFDDHVAMTADIVDEWVAETMGGDGLDERLFSFVGAAMEAAKPEVLEAVIGLASLAPELQRSARIAAALDPFVFETAKAMSEPVQPVGLFGMLGAMGDAEIQLGLGRLLHLTRALARNDQLLLSANLESRASGSPK